MISSLPSSTTTSAPTPSYDYTSQLIHDTVYTRALSQSNGAVQVSGKGKTISPYADANTAIAAAKSTISGSKQFLASSALSSVTSGNSDLSNSILNSLYANNGYFSIGSTLNAQA